MSSDFGPFIVGVFGEGESSAARGPWPPIEDARRANGKDARSALSFSSEWRAGCPSVDSPCPSSFEDARRANGKDARSELSFSGEWRAGCPRADSSCPGSFEECGCPSAIEAPALVCAPGSESSTTAKAKRSACGWGGARGAAGAIGPEAGAAASAVMASLQFAAGRGSTCVEAQLPLGRWSARARWACPCRRRLKPRGLAH